MSLGERLKIIRGGRSQTEFAAELRVSKSTYVRYERNERKPDTRFLKNVCENFNINSNWLLFGEGPQRKDMVSVLPEDRLEGLPIDVPPDPALYGLPPDPKYNEWTERVLDAMSFINAQVGFEPLPARLNRDQIIRFALSLLTRLNREELAFLQKVIHNWIELPKKESGQG